MVGATKYQLCKLSSGRFAPCAREITETDQETDQDIELLQTKTKRVTRMSRDNHAGVTRDNDGVVVFTDWLLDYWHTSTRKTYPKTDDLLDMVQEWLDAGVTKKHVQDQIQKFKNVADTPMYLKQVVLNSRNGDADIQAQNDLQKFREYYRAQKQASADADQTGGDE
jgi:uncharacterized membrane protein